jgi:hypothetical protein
MDDLTVFIRARLGEDEAIAEAAGLTGCWIAEEPAIGVVLVGGEPLIEGHIVGLTAHIARHDPARVMREVAAKRAILAEHRQVERDPQWGVVHECLSCHVAFPCRTLLLLASAWSDHPDYRDE